MFPFALECARKRQIPGICGSVELIVQGTVITLDQTPELLGPGGNVGLETLIQGTDGFRRGFLATQSPPAYTHQKEEHEEGKPGHFKSRHPLPLLNP
jgi:hypothetical protein